MYARRLIYCAFSVLHFRLVTWLALWKRTSQIRDLAVSSCAVFRLYRSRHSKRADIMHR